MIAVTGEQVTDEGMQEFLLTHGITVTRESYGEIVISGFADKAETRVDAISRAYDDVIDTADFMLLQNGGAVGDFAVLEIDTDPRRGFFSGKWSARVTIRVRLGLPR